MKTIFSDDYATGIQTIKPFSEIRQIVASACSRHPAVIAAYIFGSAAKDKTKAPKDVDVAVLLNESDSQSFPVLSFISELENALECSTDVLVLNRAGELIKYHVRRDGKLVFDRSSALRKAFEIRGRKSYEDFLYLHHKYVKKVLYGEKHD
jgi:predicted nucleotidyltransferase